MSTVATPASGDKRMESLESGGQPNNWRTFSRSGIWICSFTLGKNLEDSSLLRTEWVLLFAPASPPRLFVFLSNLGPFLFLLWISLLFSVSLLHALFPILGNFKNILIYKFLYIYIYINLYIFIFSLSIYSAFIFSFFFTYILPKWSQTKQKTCFWSKIMQVAQGKYNMIFLEIKKMWQWVWCKNTFCFIEWILLAHEEANI